MHKWSLILNILFLALIASSCVTSPDAPTLPHIPKQYIYADTPDEWCRRNKDGEIECVEDIRIYGLYSINDIAMVQLYITELNEKCEVWSEDEL